VASGRGRESNCSAINFSSSEKKILPKIQDLGLQIPILGHYSPQMVERTKANKNINLKKLRDGQN